MQESWPSVEPEGQRASPLPRIEDLPVVDRGYDPERVREAFDAFYRHVARLDATLRTIEAVEVFRDQAAELRKELRALRTAGWTQQPWLAPYSTREPARPGLPDAVFRWALEAALVIAAPVAASAADLSRLWIVLVTAGAVAIVAVAEWVASVERPLGGSQLPASASADEARPSTEATEWTLPPRAAEQSPKAEVEEEEELTVVGSSSEEPKAEPVAEAEAEAAEDAAEPEEGQLEPEPAAEPSRRGLWPWRRRRDGGGDGEGADEGRPRHVRVLPADGESGLGATLDPWEEELELEDEVEPEPTRPGS
jgi:hypothetical protein